MTNTLCNVCGEEPKKVHIAIELHQIIAYGSTKYDGRKIDLDVCANCVDHVVDAIAKVCKIPPVHIEEENEVCDW